MSYAPFDAGVEKRLNKSTQHFVKATAYPRNADPIELEVINSPQITFSEDWIPHIQATLTCAVPDDQGILDLLDARRGVHVQIDTGYVHGRDETDVHTLADLFLVERSVSRPDNTMDLRLESSETFMRERVLMGTEEFRLSGINEFMNDALRLSLGTAVFGTNFGTDYADGYGREILEDTFTDDAYVSGTAFKPERGSKMMDLIKDVSVATGAWIYSPNGIDWAAVERPESPFDISATLAIGTSGNVLTSNTEVSREKFANAVYLEYVWEDRNMLPATQSVVGAAYVSEGKFSIHEVGEQPYYERIERRLTKAQADLAAQDRLSRIVTRGASWSVQAVAYYWLRPGHAVKLTLPSGSPETLLVSAVTFEPAAGLMNITLRKPEKSVITSSVTS